VTCFRIERNAGTSDVITGTQDAFKRAEVQRVKSEKV
jgi:hypothetical protein